MTLKTKVNSVVSYIKKGKGKRGEEEKEMQEVLDLIF